jgi:ubiquinone biosynthesis protein COQ9
MTGTLKKTQAEILDAAVRHVPFDGWTLTAWMRGAADAGVSGDDARRLYPGGSGPMIACHSRLADQRMLVVLEKRDLEALRTRERITLAVRGRLEQALGDREAVRRGVSLLAMPLNAPLATRLLYRTVDAMWLAAGDDSTDYNHYTKRALLAGVYGAVLLYWLNDRSEGCADTWAFLDRRIADAMKAPELMAAPGRLFRYLPNPAKLFRRRVKWA